MCGENHHIKFCKSTILCVRCPENTGRTAHLAKNCPKPWITFAPTGEKKVASAAVRGIVSVKDFELSEDSDFDEDEENSDIRF